MIPDKPESQWTKLEWKNEAYQLREQLAAATAIVMTPPEPIHVDDAAAAEKIRQLTRQIHHLSSGTELAKLAAVRSELGRQEAPIDRAALGALRELVR